MPVLFASALALAMFGQVLGFALGPEILIVRDGLLAACVAYCLARIRDYSFLLLAIGSIGLLCVAAVADIVYRGSDAGSAVSAIRNVFSLVAIPVIACYRPTVAECVRWTTFSRACVNTAFWIFCVAILLESLIAAAAPTVYGLADSVARAFLESKGVLANVDAGLFGLPRMRTFLLNPVQGAWFLLMLWFAIPRRRLSNVLPLLGGLGLTVAKVATAGLIVWVLMRVNSLASRVVVGLAGIAVAFVFVSSGANDHQTAATHIASGLLHLEGLVSGLVHGLQHPLGSGFSRVGLAAAMSAGQVMPGMESFVGSTAAALGWIGIAVIGLSAILFIGGNAFTRAIGAVFFAGILVSDNVASLYLYAPLLLRSLASGVEHARTSPSADDSFAGRGPKPPPSLVGDEYGELGDAKV